MKYSITLYSEKIKNGKPIYNSDETLSIGTIEADSLESALRDYWSKWENPFGDCKLNIAEKTEHHISADIFKASANDKHTGIYYSVDICDGADE